MNANDFNQWIAINENKWQLSSRISTLNPCITSYNHVIIKKHMDVKMS